MFSSIPTSVTNLIIGINVLAFLWTLIQPASINAGLFWPYRVLKQREYYRFLTGGFLHADLMHLIFNLFTLYFFGRNLEWIFSQGDLGGVPAYLLFYGLALIVSDLPSFMKHRHNPSFRSLGASGAVSAVVFATILFSPWEKIYLFGALGIPAVLYAFLFVAYSIYMGKRGQDGINHDAHLWGGVFGMIGMLIWVILRNPELINFIINALLNPRL